MYTPGWHRPPTGRPPGRPFHEIPLVLFSALASAACGLALVTWPARWLLPEAPLLPAPLPAISALLMGLALLASLPHLGRPALAWRALAGLRHSPLSHEVLVALLFLMLSTSSWLLSPDGPAPSLAQAGLRLGPLLGQASGAVALLFFIILYRVYALPGQPAWGWPASLSAPLLGCAFGLLLLALVRGPAGVLLPAVGLLLLGDGALVLYRLAWYGRLARELAPLYPLAGERSRGLIGLRGAIANGLPLLLLVPFLTGVLSPAGSSAPFALTTATTLIALGLLADRACFYLLARPRSTENEQNRIERIINPTGS